jgi:uncharacterized Zn finger protein
MSLRYDQAQLRAYVGDRVFARGRAYFDGGAVSDWDAVPGGWRGTVMGTSLYEVELKAKARQPDGLCDCPAAEDGSFCKHLVALALAVMAAASDSDDAADRDRGLGKNKAVVPKRAVAKKTGRLAVTPASTAAANKQSDVRKMTATQSVEKQSPKKQPVKKESVKKLLRPSAAVKTPKESDEDLVRRWLAGLPATTVIDRAIHFAGEDRDRWRSLVAEAHAALAPPEARRETIKRLIGSPRFMDYRRTSRYAQSLEPLFGMLNKATRQDPAQALDLALYAAQRLVSVYANSDDSSGVLGDVVSRVGKCVVKAAKAHRQPNPAIVKPLFALLESEDWNIIGPLRELSPALDDRGLLELQQMAQRRLDDLPVEKTSAGMRDYGRICAQRLLESILESRGDLDGQLALRADNLRSGYDYLQLAELCENHRRRRQAIEWLERGIKAFPDETRLHEALATHYEREGFKEDALSVRRQAFERSPTAEHFLALRKAVPKKADWPALRETLYAAMGQNKSSSYYSSADMKVRFMVLDGEVDRAHTLALKEGVSLDTWQKVFSGIEESAPADAARIARRLIERAFASAYISNYDAPVAWVKKMQALARRDRDAAALYENVVQQLRTKHARKTKLMKMLDAL